MKKVLLFGLASLSLFSCAENVSRSQAHINYSLLNTIYGSVSKQEKRQVEFLGPDNSTHLNIPTYIKVYRGSYSDAQGNVQAPGFEWLKVTSGRPSTNF